MCFISYFNTYFFFNERSCIKNIVTPKGVYTTIYWKLYKTKSSSRLIRVKSSHTFEQTLTFSFRLTQCDLCFTADFSFPPLSWHPHMLPDLSPPPPSTHILHYKQVWVTELVVQWGVPHPPENQLSLSLVVCDCQWVPGTRSDNEV